MAGEWREVRLGALGEVNRGRSRHRPRNAPHLYGGPYPFIQTGDIKASNGLITEHSQTYSDAGLAQSRIWPKGTMVITIAANIAETAILTYPACFPDSVVGFIADEKKASVRFIEYLFRHLRRQIQHENVGTGSVQDNINLQTLDRLALRVPELSEQRAIAHILGTLDDKIELNRRRNQTLEAMVRALFKDWFVDFGPVRAKMEGRAPYLPADLWQLFPDRLDDEGKPEGWAKRSIYEFANVVYGAPFASKQFNATGAGTPLIRIRDLASHEPGVWTEEVHPKGHLIKPGDIVVGMDGEFRLHVWKGQPAWLNQRVCHFEALPGVPPSYLAEALVEPLAFFERGKVGTTVIHLGKGDIDTFQLLDPGASVLEAFAALAEHWVMGTVRNAQEIRTLAQLRDTLLPKLISGELRIKDAERFTEERAA